tara:strand:- start:456 stop:902 length:447 start_codon:yes stop_codon:yes gene_type:complete
MFRYNKLNDHEIQISDYPYIISFILAGVAAINTIFMIAGQLDIIFGFAIILVCLAFLLSLTKKDTNINFQTHKVSHYKRNIFKKNHAMLEIQDVEVIKFASKSNSNKVNKVYLKDQNDRIYIVIDFDIVQAEQKSQTYIDLKDELKNK